MVRPPFSRKCAKHLEIGSRCNLAIVRFYTDRRSQLLVRRELGLGRAVVERVLSEAGVWPPRTAADIAPRYPRVWPSAIPGAPSCSPCV